MKRFAVLGMLVSLLACSGGGPQRLEGYTKPFRLNGGFAVGTPSAAGVRWETEKIGEHYEGVVIATWCTTCDALLAARASDPKVRAATTNLFVYESEAVDHLKYWAGRGEFTPAELETELAAFAAVGQTLIFPEKLQGIPARVVRMEDIPAEWYPFFFTCDGNECVGWAAADL